MSPQYPAAPKAFLYPPRAVKIFKVCGVYVGGWGRGCTGQGGSCTEVAGKAPKQMRHRQTSLGGFILLLTVAYCFGSSCISITSHDWNIPRSLQFHSGFRFDLFGRVLMGPLTAPHALVDSVSSFSCFPIQPVCVRLSVSGEQPQETPRGIEMHIFA